VGHNNMSHILQAGNGQSPNLEKDKSAPNLSSKNAQRPDPSVIPKLSH